MALKVFSNQNCCAKCGSTEIARSKRKNPLEKMLGVLLLPWRCRVCYNRFFRSRSFQPEPLPAEDRRASSPEAVSSAAAR